HLDRRDAIQRNALSRSEGDDSLHDAAGRSKPRSPDQRRQITVVFAARGGLSPSGSPAIGSPNRARPLAWPPGSAPPSATRGLQRRRSPPRPPCDFSKREPRPRNLVALRPKMETARRPLLESRSLLKEELPDGHVHHRGTLHRNQRYGLRGRLPRGLHPPAQG